MRGENSPSQLQAVLIAGSSPHARGKLAAFTDSSSRSRAHPRMRGENSAPRIDGIKVNGSSPHARGKLSIPPEILEVIGLIPACAGKTSVTFSTLRAVRAHPRMRGENGCSESTRQIGSGSSPHARGKLKRCFRLFAAFRLIPACAGKTDASQNHGLHSQAHPRMRGENSPVTCQCSRTSGSSPHARGKRRVAKFPLEFPGLIPACAGKTLVRSLPWLHSGAHPRMRGENAGLS